MQCFMGLGENDVGSLFAAANEGYFRGGVHTTHAVASANLKFIPADVAKPEFYCEHARPYSKFARNQSRFWYVLDWS